MSADDIAYTFRWRGNVIHEGTGKWPSGIARTELENVAACVIDDIATYLEDFGDLAGISRISEKEYGSFNELAHELVNHHLTYNESASFNEMNGKYDYLSGEQSSQSMADKILRYHDFDLAMAEYMGYLKAGKYNYYERIDIATRQSRISPNKETPMNYSIFKNVLPAISVREPITMDAVNERSFQFSLLPDSALFELPIDLPKQKEVGSIRSVPLKENPAEPGVYYVTSSLEKVGERMLPEKMLTAQDVASATAYLSRYAVEHYDAVVTNKNGRPLAVIGSFKGTETQTSVYPATVIKELSKIKGAYYLWASHNHPSGVSSLSQADLKLNENFERLLDGSGVTYQGIISVTPDSYDSSKFGPGEIREYSGNMLRVPIAERMIQGRSLNGYEMTSPQDAKRYTREIAKDTPGIIFVSNQRQPVAFVPVNPEEVNELRTEGRLMRLINAAASTGATGAIIANPDNAFKTFVAASEKRTVAENLAAALNAIDVKALDIISYSLSKPDVAISAAESTDFRYSTTFYSHESNVGGERKSRFAHTIESARNSILGAFAGKEKYVIESMINAGLIRIINNDEAEIILNSRSKRMTAWHGSPHDHQKFDSSKIGTGEGTRAFGYGLYFAGKKEIAEYYRDNLTRRVPGRIIYDGKTIKEDTIYSRSLDHMARFGKDSALTNIDDSIRFNDKYAPGIAQLFRSARAMLEEADADKLVLNRGKLYQVDLKPDDSDLLQWERPLNEHGEGIREIVSGIDDRFTFGKDRETVSGWSAATGKLPIDLGAMTGHEFYSHVSRILSRESISQELSNRMASEYLLSLGIRGIKYLDASSRDAGEGTFNYVIFDDRDIEIVAKFSHEADGDMNASIEKLKQRAALSQDEFENFMSNVESADDAQKYTELNDLAANAQNELVHSLAQIPDDHFALHAEASGGRFNILSASAQKPGLWQLTRFDKEGQPWGDTQYPEKLQAIKEFVTESNISTLTGFEVDGSQAQGEILKPQTETPEFLNWFGDSKAVDPYGKPLVVYHGTTGDFNIFDPARIGQNFPTSKVGFYFSNSPVRSGIYADSLVNAVEKWRPDSPFSQDVRNGANIMPVYLSLKNPFVVTTDTFSPEDFLDDNYGKVVVEAKKSGHDGVIVNTKHKQSGYVVFHQTQIKSAIGNNGEFDSLNPDIRFSQESKTLAFNHSNGITYFIADNIRENYTAKEWRGLVLHEIAVHALQMGKSDQEFRQILGDLRKLRKAGNSQVLEAYDSVHPSTKSSLIDEEALAYLIQKNPDLSICARFALWLKKAIHRIGDFMEPVYKIPFYDWAKSLTVNDLVSMAHDVLSDHIRAAGRDSLQDEIYASHSPQRFYSQLRNVIRNAPENIFTTGAALNLWLRANAGKYGIKKDEIFWTGISDWLNVQNKVSKYDVMNYLSGNGVQVQEVMLGKAAAEEALSDDFKAEGYSIVWDEDGMNYIDPEGEMVSYSDLPEKLQRIVNSASKEYSDTKYHSYQLPGGENYRELLLMLPKQSDSYTGIDARKAVFDKYAKEIETYQAIVNSAKSTPVAREAALTTIEDIMQRRDKEADAVYKLQADKAQFRTSHFDQLNILAHIRFNERTDAEGNKVLFIEELQSDWGQKGKKEGFINEDTAKLNAAKKEYSELVIRNINNPRSITPADKARIVELQPIVRGQGLAELGVPSAPFVTDTKSWTALAMKKIIAYAADNGFDRVAWTTGEQQAERYDLSKQIDAVEYKRDPEGGGVVIADDESGRKVIEQRIDSDDKLEDFIGKEAAQKIMQQKPIKNHGTDAESYVLNNADLKTGGEGMKGYYDQIVPQVANDILKKLGGKVETVTVENDVYELGEDGVNRWKRTEQPGFTITPEIRHKVLRDGLPLFSHEDNFGNIKSACSNYMDINKSFETASNIASHKSEGIIIPSRNSKYTGIVIGESSLHVVLSIGRQAVIYLKNEIDRIPDNNESVAISMKDGKGIVISTKQHTKDASR